MQTYLAAVRKHKALTVLQRSQSSGINVKIG
jgi:hypothetical protein